jgi:CheY-like chemotaxis protein
LRRRTDSGQRPQGRKAYTHTVKHFSIDPMVRDAVRLNGTPLPKGGRFGERNLGRTLDERMGLVSKITVAPRVGEFTEFIHPAAAAPTRPNSQRVVLVVEDEILVRSVTSEFLRDSGYTVLEAINAAEAISILASGTTVDIVYSDIELHDAAMDGVDLARWVSEHHPDVRLMLTSGNGHSARAAGRAAFLKKPHRVMEALDRIIALLVGDRRTTRDQD